MIDISKPKQNNEDRQDQEGRPMENAMTVEQPPRQAPVGSAGREVASGSNVLANVFQPQRPMFTFLDELRLKTPQLVIQKRQLDCVSPNTEMPKRPKVGLKSLVKLERRGRRVPITVDADEIRASAHVELSDLLGVNCRTNVHFTFEEVQRLNDFIKSAGNIRSDITRSGLSLLVLVRQAEELWKEMRSRYAALEQEARTERAERILLEARVKALEDHNTSHPLMEVDERGPWSETHTLREQNAVLIAKVEELTKALNERVAAPPAAQDPEVAELARSKSELQEKNQALSVEVTKLTETISALRESMSRDKLEEPSELQSQEGPAMSKSEKRNRKKKRNASEPSKTEGSASSAASSAEVAICPVAQATVGDTTGDGTGKEDAGGFTLVQRKKARSSKPKPRTKSEAVAIKAEESEYANILRRLRSDPGLVDLGRDTKSVRRTRQNELLLILNKGAKTNSSEYARRVREVVGNDSNTTVRALGSEISLQCKNLDETVRAEDLLVAISTQCGIEPLQTSMQFRRYAQGTQTATFKLPATIATTVLKVGKIKVNWSICPITTIDRPAVCFKCLQFGHKSWDCKGPDRSKLCRKCGKEGHKASVCKEKPRCLICTEGGVNHVTGSYNCPSFKRAQNKLRPCK